MSPLSPLGVFAFAPTAGGDYESIETITLGSAATEITFSSIPSTYKHLEIRGIARTTRSGSGYDWFTARFNGDTGSKYSFHILMGTGSAPYYYPAGSQTSMYVGALSQASTSSYMYGAFITSVLDYAKTSKYKVIRTGFGHEIDANNTESLVGQISGSWQDTAAVTSMTFLIPGGYQFAAGTSLSLFGIKG
jgi:hypothetical protein